MWNIRNITKVSSFCNLRGSIKRTYLSEAYQLTKEWNQRLETSFLEKINSESLYVDLSTKFQQKKKISAIDVDIYVNKVTEKNLEEAVDVTHKLRTTAQASNILDSTQHALIRLAQNHPDTLISILNHRLDYGIFLSPHTANLLLNKFLLEKNYMVAARIATLQMLQEDFENPITCYMSLYACYKFLHELRTFNDLILPVSIQEEETSKPKKKIEEIKVRVAYLRNPYFDDHFDLKNTNHLLGKTFIALSDEIGHNNSALANSIKLLGFALYEKFEDGAKFIKKSQKEEFCSEVVERVKAFGQELENLSDDEKNFYDSINKISSQNKSKVEEVLETLLQKVVAEQEAKDINDQKEVGTFYFYSFSFSLSLEYFYYYNISALCTVD